jgi:hypothetical protein|tara:strand:- start:34 stop:330 length:297 start_codon:yes stop_codon:yes gene_type:complete
MAILPKEKPKSYKKKKSIETLKKIKPFLEKESFEYARKELKKKYEHPVLSAVKEAASIVSEKHKTKAKNVWGGIKHTINYLRNPKDRKFLGHTDNKNK